MLHHVVPTGLHYYNKPCRTEKAELDRAAGRAAVFAKVGQCRPRRGRRPFLPLGRAEVPASRTPKPRPCRRPSRRGILREPRHGRHGERLPRFAALAGGRVADRRAEERRAWASWFTGRRAYAWWGSRSLWLLRWWRGSGSPWLPDGHAGAGHRGCSGGRVGAGHRGCSGGRVG
jgi:hypothetical protein